MTDIERRGQNLLVQARVNGRSRYTAAVYDIRGNDPVHVVTDLVNLSSQRARQQLSKRVPDGLQEEFEALATEVAHDAVALQQREAERATAPTPTAPKPEERWPDAVSGTQVLDEIASTVERYVVLPSVAVTAVTLWTAHTYVLDVTDYTPYLHAYSAVRECGKSTLLEILLSISHRAQLTGGITAAALYRRIDRSAPAMLLDELDTRLRGDGGEALRGVLNTGFHRSGKVTICVGDDHEEKDFATFCPKVLAGIGRLWDTVASRCIPIRMERAAKEELQRIQKIRGDTISELCQPLRRRLLRWALDERSALRGADPDSPEELGARQSDVWRPLLAIADNASDAWGDRARSAALVLHNGGDDETDVGLLLLEDVRTLLEERGGDAIYTETLLDALTKREDRPWPEYRHDKPITARGIASLMGRFQIKPKTVRIDLTTGKGYRAQDLAPAFRRYLPKTKSAVIPLILSVTSVTTATMGPEVTDVTDRKQGIGPFSYEADERAGLMRDSE